MFPIIDENEKSQELFAIYKQTNPDLKEVKYYDNQIIFPEGIVAISTSDFKKLPAYIFDMNRANIYIYLSNQFFKHEENSYRKEIDTIFNLFTQLSISEEDTIILKKFAYDFLLRLQLFSSETNLSNDEDYVRELMERRKVITESYKSSSLAAGVITSTYNQNLQESINKQNQENDNNPGQGQTYSQGLSLSRTKDGFPPIINNDDDKKIGAAGFTKIILILETTIVFGLYLAYFFLK